MGHSLELPLFAELLEHSAAVESTTHSQSSQLTALQQAASVSGDPTQTKPTEIRSAVSYIAPAAKPIPQLNPPEQQTAILQTMTPQQPTTVANQQSTFPSSTPWLNSNKATSSHLTDALSKTQSTADPSTNTQFNTQFAPNTTQATTVATYNITANAPTTAASTHPQSSNNSQSILTTSLFQAQQQENLNPLANTATTVHSSSNFSAAASKRLVTVELNNTHPATRQPTTATAPSSQQSPLPSPIATHSNKRQPSQSKSVVCQEQLTTASPSIPEYTVSDLASLIKKRLENEWSYIRVKGEISGLKYNSSGHIYFNLKDANALLNVVCFRNIATTLTIKLAEGQEVTVGGKLTTYAGRSNYQLNAETIRYSGIGAILQQLAILKERLTKEGLFKPEHKLKLPTFPWRLGLITSSTGAVIQDMLHRLRDRFPTQVYLYPVPVQGKEASNQIIRALQYFQHSTSSPVDLLVIARGGGSLEDLLPFSDEALLRAVYQCTLPVVSAIGHETDFPLLDLVADLRAPTPTAAIELTTPVAAEVRQNLQSQRRALSTAINQCYQTNQQLLDRLNTRRQLRGQHIYRQIERLTNLIQVGKAKFEQRVQQILAQLRLARQTIQHLIQQNLNHHQQQLLQLNRFPLIRQQFLQTIATIQHDLPMQLQTHLTQLCTTLATTQQQLQQLHLQIHSCLQNLIQQTSSQVALQRQQLQQHDLQQLLDRGYSILYDSSNQHPIYAATELTPEMEINIHYRGYNIRAKILDLQSLPTTKQ